MPEHAGFPPKRASEATCDELEREASDLVAKLHGPCATDDDCELLSSVCPFGCYQIVSRQVDRSRAEAALGRFFRRCAVCKNKCVQPPTRLACVGGQCMAPRLAVER